MGNVEQIFYAYFDIDFDSILCIVWNRYHILTFARVLTRPAVQGGGVASDLNHDPEGELLVWGCMGHRDVMQYFYWFHTCYIK